MSKRKEALTYWMDKGVSALLSAISKLPWSQDIENRLLKPDTRGTPPNAAAQWITSKLVPIICVAFALSFTGKRLIEFGSWPPAIYQSHQVFNLTTAKVAWDVHYGPSLGCPNDSCYVDPATPSAYFSRREILPIREFPLKNWTGGKIYYRARVSIPDHVLKSAETRPLSLHTILMFAETWDLYINKTLVFQGTKETMLAPIPINAFKDSSTIDIAIVAVPGDQPYQGIANRGDLVIGPRSELLPLNHFARDNATSLQLIYLLPKMTFCVVFAILFLFLRTNQEIAWLLIYGLASSVELYLRSDFSARLPFSGEVTALLALMARNYAILAFARFGYAFFRLRVRRAEKFADMGIIALTIFNLACVTVIPYSLATKYLDIIAIITKPASYLSIVVLALLMASFLSKNPLSKNRSRVALLFAIVMIAGSILAILDLYKLIAMTFGLKTPAFIVNLTWLFDLVLFMFISTITAVEIAIQFSQRKFLAERLQNLNDRLELASTVQSTLLPSPLKNARNGLSWECYYTADERLAGDWIFVSEPDTGARNFFLGDVTGKGPAAALAVAAIVSLLRKKDFEPTSLSSQIKELNKHLFHLFRGSSSTALCAASIDSSGLATIACHGMTGWLHLREGKTALIPARGNILGTGDHMDTNPIQVQLEKGDILVCFSDGCFEGQRALKKFCDSVASQNLRHQPLEAVINAVLVTGAERQVADDKAVLIVKRL